MQDIGIQMSREEMYGKTFPVARTTESVFLHHSIDTEHEY